MAAAGRRGGIWGRLVGHSRSKRKASVWTHFSAFEVWDNIRDEEAAELDGLLRHIYRDDPEANTLNSLQEETQGTTVFLTVSRAFSWPLRRPRTPEEVSDAKLERRGKCRPTRYRLHAVSRAQKR